MTRILSLILLTLCLSGTDARADRAQRLAEALELRAKAEWTAAGLLVRNDGQVTRDILEWHRLRDGEGRFEEVLAFLGRNPDWPGLDYLRRKSEAGFAAASPAQVLAFFAEFPPQSPEGVLIHAEALARDGQQGEAQASLVIAWRTMSMGPGIHAEYLKKHRALITPHHEARLDRMLWDGHLASARRMLPLVADGPRALAEARLTLKNMAPGVDARIKAVPEALQGAPGLAHDRFVWRARKGRTEDAKTLLEQSSRSAETLGEPDKWARRRRDLARDEMRNGDPNRAYRLAARHYLTEGSSFADLEWLAGYLALTRLGDPKTALAHFIRFDGAVASPISKGRAGYWIGRAQEALGNAEAAHDAYEAGARFQTSFYGLLAAEQLGRPFDPALAKPNAPPPWREAAFTRSSVFQAGLLLLEADARNLGERFLTHLTETLDPGQIAQLGAMAIEMDRPHLAVMIGKRAAQRGLVIPAPYYAVHAVGQMRLPMAAEMNLAIARRESEFDPIVVSGAGARGLMQVMPATARAVAGSLGILANHSTDQLLTNWRYNAKLGANYLADLAGKLDGNVVMMAAGYNAGPNRPLRWMEEYGNPLAGDIGIVDWIELIPFNETRNYVMRVTESLPIYRARLGQPALPIPFSRELTGSTLKAFAP